MVLAQYQFHQDSDDSAKMQSLGLSERHPGYTSVYAELRTLPWGQQFLDTT